MLKKIGTVAAGIAIAAAGCAVRAIAQPAIVPSQAVAPWWALRYVNALDVSASDGVDKVHGAYHERSEGNFTIDDPQHSQELGVFRPGSFVTYAGLDFGSGTESLMLRVSVPNTQTATIEVRLGSSAGKLAGTCKLGSTGAVESYRVVGCKVAKSILKGRQDLVLRFTAAGPDVRLNWLAFFAKDTMLRIDEIQKVASQTWVNPVVPNSIMAGTPVRSRKMLPAKSETSAATYGAWKYVKAGECPTWLHDTYWTRGADGKVYPTWHPPVGFNPDTGKLCTYAHEHGDDPRGSRAFDVGGMPAFGYVNEQHEPASPALRRTEDHVGHKVRVVNGMKLYRSATGEPQVCDLGFKLHMGTHSMDALTNTAHESLAWGRCEGMQPFAVAHFALFGAPGGFKEAEAAGCNRPVDPGLRPNPPGQPTGGQHRAIPTRDCFLRGTAAERSGNVHGRLTEFWLTSAAGAALYAVVLDPSRHHDPAGIYGIGRTAELCYVPGHPLESTDRCQLTVAASPSRVPWNDPRSWFRGARHGFTHIAGISFANSPSAIVYTNAYGQSAQVSPDPATGITVKQLVPVAGFDLKVDGSASIFAPTDYSAAGRNGVRAPN